jgi:hypothetical protein
LGDLTYISFIKLYGVRLHDELFNNYHDYHIEQNCRSSSDVAGKLIISTKFESVATEFGMLSMIFLAMVRE